MKMNSENIVMRLKIFDSEKKINLEFPRKDAEHSENFTLYMHVAPALRIYLYAQLIYSTRMCAQ